MASFFHGWQRKSGAVVLFLACLLMACWMRSLSVKDVFVVNSKAETAQFVVFASGYVEFINWHSTHSVPRLGTSHQSLTLSEKSFCERYRVASRRQLMGMEITRGTVFEWVRVTAYRIPYAAFVVPVTLIAAGLLLVKPHSTVKPSAVDG